MSFHIIVEGMDNTGKTTLMERLQKELKLSGRSSNGRPHSIEEMFTRMMGYIAAPGTNLHDRIHFISDQVYGPILRNENPFETQIGQDIINVFKNTPHLIIYARPPREVILNFDGRQQMDGVIEKSAKLLDRYDELIRSMINEGGWNIITYDYNDHEDYSDIKKRIGELANG